MCTTFAYELFILNACVGTRECLIMELGRLIYVTLTE